MLHICMCERECANRGAWAYAFGCVRVVLLIQYAIRMRHIITSFVTPLAPPYISTLSHKRHDFRKKKKVLNIN